MLCFLYNLPIITLVLWVLSLQMSCKPILILSNHHARLHKLFLFSGDRHFMSGDNFIILGCQKATSKKFELGALLFLKVIVVLCVG